MWIDVEPGDLLMMRYLLCFERGDPDPEDAHIRAYMRTHKLEPRRVWTGERQGVACEVVQFGQCYLDRHLQVIESLRIRGIAAGGLAVALRDLPALAEMTAGMTDQNLRDLAWDLAQPALEQEALLADGDDPTRIHVDAEFLERAVRERLVAVPKTDTLTSS